MGRVKVIFQLPARLKLIGTHTSLAPSYWPKFPLAYVEWYTAPTLTVQQQNVHNMATVSKPPTVDGHSVWSIIPLSNIRQSCMLTPNFESAPIHDQSAWTTVNILDSAPSFFVNNWSSVYTYKTIYKE